jgi:thiamine-phosphate pyrophosphorylase
MNTRATHAERLALFQQVDLYVVTCEPLSAGRSDAEVLEAVIAGGGRIIQLRDKESSPRDFYAKAAAFRRRTLDAGLLLIINDYLDVALAVEADGVHLGQDDLPLAAARQLAPELIIGRSTHSRAQALEAQEQGASYVNIGPLFPTGTKNHAKPLGIQAVRDIAPELHIPFTVMGGIKRAHISELVEAGATRIAVVTAVTHADDMVAAVRTLRAAINNTVRPAV